MRKRDPLYDVVKAVLMLWVVWGHFIRYGIVSGPLAPDPYMKNAKIGVDMPLFFVIGGLLSSATIRNGSRKKILAHLLCLLWPAASFGLLFAALGGMIHWHSPEILIRFLARRVLYGHWFLRTLAAVYLISTLILRIFKTDGWRWFGFGAMWLTLLFFSAQFPYLIVFGGWQTIHMLPYFVFGLMVLDRKKVYSSTFFSLSCGVVFFATVLLEGDSSTNGMNYWAVATNWEEIMLDVHGWSCFLARMVMGLAGSVFFLWGFGHLLSTWPWLSSLAVFGTTTLGVYVLHEWPLHRVGSVGSQYLPLPAWSGWPLTLAWFLVCHVIILGIRKVFFLKVFFFGDERFLVDVLGKGASWVKSLPGFPLRRK